MTANRPILAASAAVFRDGRVLLAQRARGPASGAWSLPGGRVESGESVAEAALRELMEEVGVEAEIVGLAGYVDVIPGPDRGPSAQHFVVLAFAARWRAGEAATGPEAADVRWVDPATLGGLAVTRGLGQIVGRAAAMVAGGT